MTRRRREPRTGEDDLEVLEGDGYTIRRQVPSATRAGHVAVSVLRGGFEPRILVRGPSAFYVEVRGVRPADLDRVKRLLLQVGGSR